jgi:predicted Zn-dependent protease
MNRKFAAISYLALFAILALVASSCSWVTPHPACSGDDLNLCLERQSLLDPLASDSCDGIERRVCIAPLGQVSPSLVKHLVDYYQDEYGLEITILTPSAIPPEFVNYDREQVDTGRLMALLGDLFPQAIEDPNAVLIALTHVDVYIEGVNWRYAFAANRGYDNATAVISSARMDPTIYHEGKDDELFYARVRKMFTKYLGLLYYGLDASDDKRSPMFNNILGPSDLDRMTEPLPVR